VAKSTLHTSRSRSKRPSGIVPEKSGARSLLQ
jgi:hypothetical protein